MPIYRSYSLAGIGDENKNWLQRWLLRVGPYGSALFGLSTILLIWLGAFYFIQSEQEQTQQAAASNATNLARTFEEQIIRSIRAADQTLLYVRDSYAKDPDQFDISLWNHNSQFLNGFNFQVVVIDKKGLMVASNIPGSKPGLDLSDREHFRVHAERQVDELFISKPILGRVSQKWSIQLTRRITMPDGSFGGVAVVSLDPDYLATFYESIDVGEKGAVSLVGTDGIVRARGAKGPSVIGKSVAAGSLLRAYSNSPTGFYSGKSDLDGVERMSVYRGVRGYPLIVSVGFAQDELFAAYRRHRTTYIATALLLTLWLVGATFVMARYDRMLAKSRDAAEAGTRARSEFLAMMSHEIRTPMNGVIGMAEVLLESGLTREQLPLAKTMRESAQYLLQIINDVLDFSKLEAGRVEIEHIRFDLHEVVRSTVGVLAAHAEEKGLTLPITIDADTPRWVTGDPARLRQLLLNLVGNGLKFTKTGHVAISVSTGKQQTADKTNIVFSVTDTGIGIPQDGIALLFRKFSQLDSTISRRFGGTGLGLAICKRLIDLLGGSIVVESELGKGTTFRFALDFSSASANPGNPPIVAQEVPVIKSPPTANHRAADGDELRILVVEDNKTNQLVIEKLLQQFGLRADIANNGLEAVEACAHTSYDLVFMDVMMPEMDGLTATREIRKLCEPFCSAHIVALTANAHEQDRQMCLGSGMDEFLSKPVTRKALQEKLQCFGGKLAPSPQKIQPDQEKPEEAGPFNRKIYAELADVLGPEDMKMIVDSFLTETGPQLDAMHAAAKRGDNAAVRRSAHAVKSSAANLGFIYFSTLAKEIERDALGLGWPALGERIASLEKSFAEIRSIIAENSLDASHV